MSGPFQRPLDEPDKREDDYSPGEDTTDVCSENCTLGRIQETVDIESLRRMRDIRYSQVRSYHQRTTQRRDGIPRNRTIKITCDQG